MDASALRVLVVDDHVDSADSLSHLLEALGCQAVPAYDAVTALKASGTLLPQGLMFLPLTLGGALMAAFALAQLRAPAAAAKE